MTNIIVPYFVILVLTKVNLLIPYYAVGIVGQQNFAIISSAHGLFWIEKIVSYFKIKNGSKCFRLKQNKVEKISNAKSGFKYVYSNQTLVIIGYSFPYFNREVDRLILQNMNQLKNVYIQSLPDNAVEIAQRFQNLRTDFNIKSNNLKIITDVNQFYLPPEL